MPDERSDLLQGTLDMLVLRVLAVEPMHGWGISERIQQMSGDVFSVPQGSLYPALQRLMRKGWIRGEEGRSANNRPARYYALTASGVRRLETEMEGWRRASSAVNRVLDPGLSES